MISVSFLPGLNNLLSATNVLVAFCLATSAEFSGGNII